MAALYDRRTGRLTQIAARPGHTLAMSTFPAASAAIRAAIAASSLWDGTASDGGERLWLDIGPPERNNPWLPAAQHKRPGACCDETIDLAAINASGSAHFERAKFAALD
jgi:hypothetical protein